MTSLRKMLLAGMACCALTAGAAPRAQAGPRYARVLLISIDGFHRVDMQNWVGNHPDSTLAQLSRHGTNYSAALTTTPSDSFPGMIAQVTGATPRSAGVFYDDSYDRTMYAPGSNCVGVPGTETQFAENIDKDKTRLDAGGTLGQPISQIDPAQLPMRYVNGVCEVVYPHQFIRVNTVFEVIRSHGGYTAWCDKHPAYDILNGPSGKGIDDLYTPEINSDIPGYPGMDNTTSFTATRINDQAKVQAVLNEIDGLGSTGANTVGVPTIMGLNFQAVSVGQKLAVSGPLDAPGLTGGYTDAAATPGVALAQQIAFVDGAIGQMVGELASRGLDSDTLVIVSAKHGQSPIDLSLRRAISDKPYATLPGYGFHVADDVALVWLTPETRAENIDAVQASLEANKDALGIRAILDRDELVKYFKDPETDSRTPDFLVATQKGVIYTGGSKLAEHGGIADDDRSVALLVSAPNMPARVVSEPVETTQIAPTILTALGLSPKDLKGVRREGTAVLPRADQDNEQ